MLPLNHTDTPPVSICEAAPVPYVSLWGNRIDLQQQHWRPDQELWVVQPKVQTSMQSWPQPLCMFRGANGDGDADLLELGVKHQEVQLRRWNGWTTPKRSILI